jgi:hypothetical protein
LDLDEKSKVSVKKTNTHEVQIKNLEKYSEENYKEIRKINEKTEKLRSSQESLIEKSDRLERNIIKLNNEILRINEIENTLNRNKTQIDSFYKDYQDFEYFTNKKFSDTESNILTLVSKVTELNQHLKSSNSNINNTNEFNINNITNNKNRDSSNSNSHISNLQFFKPEDNSSILKINKDIESLKKINKEFYEKLEKFSYINNTNDNLLLDLNNKINDTNYSIKDSLENLKEKFNKKLEEELEKKKDKKIENENNESYKLNSKQQIEIIYDQLNIIHELIKSNTQLINTKISKDDAEKIYRFSKSEVEKVLGKLNDFDKENASKINIIVEKYLDFDNKLKKISEKLNSENTEEGVENFNINIFNKIGSVSGSGYNNGKLNEKMNFFFQELVKNKIIEFFSGFSSQNENVNINIDINNINNNNAFNNISNYSIKSIPLFKELFDKIQENKNEIFTISNILGETNKEKETNLNKIESRVNLFILKLNELNDLFFKNNMNNEERFKNIEGDLNFMDDLDIQNLLYPNMNVFNAIKLNIINRNKDSKRVDKIIFDLENFNKDILNKLKKDLNNESLKILGDFKFDLKNSITKIEDQLREKVDLFSLDEFGKKVDNKLNNEFNKKLDKQDLMKNNNIINKKIDCLENKISKTLVDTILDLQMEDTPLIIKKSMTGNANKKCASCNQYLLNEKNGHNNCMVEDENRNTYNNLNINNTINNNNNLSKYKFRSIQDNSNKYGTGSYSRHLINIDNEDLRGGERKIFYNQLPNIPERNTRSSVKKNINNNSNNNNHQSLRNSFYKLKINEATERRFNSMIEEELEKSIVNPDNFIKTANKIHENAEKNMILRDIIDK